MASGTSLSVVIPLRPGETDWQGVARSLAHLPPDTEIVCVSPAAPPPLAPDGYRMVWVKSPLGRGRQLNLGAEAARGSTLWFLHADSSFDERAVASLFHALETKPDALHYFNLAFANDGPKLLALNALGVWARSHVLGMPFGDQGFCMRREVFARLGGFREEAPYGEDHLLVWQAAAANVPLNCTGATITTSARKYQTAGWLKTTLRHLAMTYTQAFHEWRKL